MGCALQCRKMLMYRLKFKHVNRLIGVNVEPVHKNFIRLGMGALSILQEKYLPFACLCAQT